MKNLTWRSIVLGLVGLLITTTSSMYVALRLGALPWPTVFVTILSMTVLTKFKDSTIQEINVCHTLMSSGSMVAGGLAFTLPGLWILYPQENISIFQVTIITVSGAVLGTLFSWLFRQNLIEERKLVFPIGNAAYETLVNGIKKGKQALKLFISMGLSIIFSILRDILGLIPSVITIFQGKENITMWVSPMAMSIGAIIDKISMLLWAGGMVIGYFILSPLGFDLTFRQSLGIGLMLGTGFGILIKAVIQSKKQTSSKSKIERSKLLICLITVITVSVIVSVFTQIKIYEALLACLGICLVSLISGLLTGQSGINPMEVFGIIVTLIVSFLFKTQSRPMFFLAALTAVSCGLSGDVMNDLKSGHMLGTSPQSQLFAEGLGGVIGAVISVFALFIMKKAYGSFGTEILPAPQASAVASMIGGFGNTKIIVLGLIVGAVITVIGPSAATLGLGIYLSIQISLTVCFGALVAFIARTLKAKDQDINLVSSGALGGEGITGVVSAIVSML